MRSFLLHLTIATMVLVALSCTCSNGVSSCV